MSQKKGRIWTALSGLVGVAILAFLTGAAERIFHELGQRVIPSPQESVPSSSAPSTSDGTSSGQPNPDYPTSKPPSNTSPTWLDTTNPNISVVDPLTTIQRMVKTPLATKDFYKGKTILVRFDAKVNANTIRTCSSSQRCISTDVESQEIEDPPAIAKIKCVFPKNYNLYPERLNKELFPGDKNYTLTLEGYLKDLEDIEINKYFTADPSFRITMLEGSFELQRCQVVNINRAG
jgi:hypothetical protein